MVLFITPFPLLSPPVPVSLFSLSNFFPNLMGILINRLCPGNYFVHQTVSNYRASPFPLRIFTNRWFCQFCISNFFWISMGISIKRLCPARVILLCIKRFAIIECPSSCQNFYQQVVLSVLFCTSNLFQILSGILINRLCLGYVFVHQTPSNYLVVLSVFFLHISNFFPNLMGILSTDCARGIILFIKPFPIIEHPLFL